MMAEAAAYSIDGYPVTDDTVLWSYREYDWVTIKIDKTNSDFPLTSPNGGRWAADGHLTQGVGGRDLFWDKLDIIPPTKPKRKVKEPVELFVNSFTWGMGGKTYQDAEQAKKDVQGTKEEKSYLETVSLKGERTLLV